MQLDQPLELLLPRQLAIGTLLASRVPIQVDAKHISGGGLGGAWGSTWPLGAGSLVLGALVYQHEPDPEGHRPPTMKKARLGIDQKFVMVDREPLVNALVLKENMMGGDAISGCQ